MFELNEKVLVIDQRPPVVGQIVEVSTWAKVIGPPADDEPCFKVKVPQWQNEYWFAIGSIEKLSEAEY